jgi:sarcosine oxidase subunit beta
VKSHEIVVIGGGVIGASVAYHLAKSGHDAALVERGDIASGTSSHCDACAMITDKQPGADVALGAASINLFKELAAELQYDFDFVQRGSLYVCETDLEMEVAAKYIRDLQAEGYSVHMCDKKELAEREPYLAADLQGGFWSDACSSMNPYKLCYAFVEESKKYNFSLCSHTEVKGIQRDGNNGRILAVETDNGLIKAEKIINCAGCWAPEIGKMVGLDIPIQPRKGTILLSETAFSFVRQKVQEFGYMLTKFNYDVKREIPPEVEKYNVSFTLEPTHDNNCMLGSSRNFFGFDTNSEIEIINTIARRGIRFFPVLKELNCIRAYSGIRPFVPDHLPIMSAVEEVPGYYIAAGHEGDGIAMSPISGKLMAQLLDGEKTDLDMKPFRFSRFKETAGI